MTPERKNPIVQSYRDLEVYKATFQFQQAVFSISKNFPKEEMYSLTDQARRSSRSVGANITEAWSKRSYEAHFRSKLTDADGELQESTHWIDTAIACEYLTEEQYEDLMSQLASIGAMLGRMIANHRAFCY